jgi:hypothetical protein
VEFTTITLGLCDRIPARFRFCSISEVRALVRRVDTNYRQVWASFFGVDKHIQPSIQGSRTVFNVGQGKKHKVFGRLGVSSFGMDNNCRQNWSRLTHTVQYSTVQYSLRSKDPGLYSLYYCRTGRTHTVELRRVSEFRVLEWIIIADKFGRHFLIQDWDLGPEILSTCDRRLEIEWTAWRQDYSRDWTGGDRTLESGLEIGLETVDWKTVNWRLLTGDC